MHTKHYNLVLASATFFLMSCGSGDKSTISQINDDGSVQLYGAKVAINASSLPECDSVQVGQLFFVLEDELFQFCSTKGYQSIDLRGAAGADGTNGKDGSIGSDGDDGINGKNGTNGVDGEDGSSCSVIVNANKSKTIMCEDGTTATLTDGASCSVVDNGDGSYDLACSGTTVTVRDGEDGIDGIDGEDGVDGVDGINGTSFLSGTIAPRVALGADGDTYLDTFRSAFYKKISGVWVLQYFDATRSFQDSRDQRIYKTATIGTQTWMAENLNYDTLPGTGSWCLKDTASYCDTYGRLYDWSTVMGVSPTYSSTMLNDSVLHTGICPSGWHVPKNGEWAILESKAEESGWPAPQLMSVAVWIFGGCAETDDFGFSAMPGGYYNGSYSDDGWAGSWWTATENSATEAKYREMEFNVSNVYSSDYSKKYRLSLRCIKN